MRNGVNPEKFKGEKNIQYWHRIIIPVYIPNINEEYYKESLTVLDYCLNSITQTINPKTTAITLINNNSTSIIDEVIGKYRLFIDKYVLYDENKGKVYAAYSEALASYEPYITIADADILFFSGWETAVFEIFSAFPKAGVVAPVPSQSLAFSHNNSIFFNKYLLNKIKLDKVVSDEDCELYLKGLGNPSSLDRNNRAFSWKEKQYFVKNNTVAILGSGHYVATYRKEIFKNKQTFPNMKFLNGFEDTYFDKPADSFGWYRLSAAKAYAYHIGNKMDNFVKITKFDEHLKVNPDLFLNLKSPAKSFIPYWIKSIFFRALKRFMKL